MNDRLDNAIRDAAMATIAGAWFSEAFAAELRRQGLEVAPVVKPIQAPVCSYCWGDRPDGLTDAEWGDQVARCREYKPSYDAIRSTLAAYGKPFTGRLGGAHATSGCPKCGQPRWTGASDAEWLAEVDECQANKEKG